MTFDDDRGREDEGHGDGVHEDEGGYQAGKDTVGVLELPRDVIRAEGPDAATFLQGQLSQDVAGLAPGQSAWSLVLAPAGRVDALVRVTRGDGAGTGDGFIIDTDAGWGETLLTRLNRFKLRTKISFEVLDWRTVALRGPAAVIPPPRAGSPLVVDASWPGLNGVDLIGPAPDIPDDIVSMSRAAYEALRIEAGIPVMGAELTEATIPAEAGIVERTVSFTKGCYTGQELVARIDSRGSNVARRLRGILLDGPVESGTPLSRDGKNVGWVTSVGHSPKLGSVALGYVARSVEPPAEVTVGEDGSARIRVLPLPG